MMTVLRLLLAAGHVAAAAGGGVQQLVFSPPVLTQGIRHKEQGADADPAGERTHQLLYGPKQQQPESERALKTDDAITPAVTARGDEEVERLEPGGWGALLTMARHDPVYHSLWVGNLHNMVVDPTGKLCMATDGSGLVCVPEKTDDDDSSPGSVKSPASKTNDDRSWLVSEPRTRFLLLDKHVVDRNESRAGNNVSLVLGRATKEATNPLICEDRPWEVTWLNTQPDIWFDNLTSVWHFFYLSCLSCPLPITRPGACPTANYKFKYRPAATYNGNKINPHARVMGTLYGNSSDGIEWEKPILNLVGGVITLILCCCPCAAAYLDCSASLSI
jgi:hypothetical protein